MSMNTSMNGIAGSVEPGADCAWMARAESRSAM